MKRFATILCVLATLPISVTAQEACSPSVRPGPVADGYRTTGFVREQAYDTPDEWVADGEGSYIYAEGGELEQYAFTSPDGEQRLTYYMHDTFGRVTHVDRSGPQAQDEEFRYVSDTEAEKRISWLGGSDWDSYIYRYLYVYSEDCLLQLRRSERYDGQVESWVPASRAEYTYDEDGIIISLENFGDSFGANPDAPYNRFSYEYENGYLSMSTEEFWRQDNQVWDFWARLDYSNAENGRVDTLKTYRYNSMSEEWILDQEIEYEYSEEGNRTSYIMSQEWSGVFRPVRKMFYAYEPRLTLSNEEGVENHTSLAVVKDNPFAFTTSVRLTLYKAESASVIVYDAMGRAVSTVHSGMLSSGDHDWPLGATLAPGLYVVQARTASWRETVRVVKTQ